MKISPISEEEQASLRVALFSTRKLQTYKDMGIQLSIVIAIKEDTIHQSPTISRTKATATK